jgi:hypothetical protein
VSEKTSKKIKLLKVNFRNLLIFPGFLTYLNGSFEYFFSP